MHNYQIILGTVAGIIALVSYAPYILSILGRKTVPNRATFGIWAAIGCVQVASYIAAGARTTIWLPLVYTFGSMAVFVLSIRHGTGGAQKLDIFCMIGALIGVVVWIITSNPQFALYCGLFASSCGFLPTIKKTYRRPETENALSWGMTSLAGACNVLAISSLALHIALYPACLFALDTSIALLAIFPRLRPAKATSQIPLDSSQTLHQLL